MSEAPAPSTPPTLPDPIAACAQASVALLRRNLTPHGILAARRTPAAEARRYTRIFGRDAAVCVLAMCGSGVAALEQGAVNSLDALEDLPSERRRLSLTAQIADPQTVEVAVSDHGQGIPAEKLSDIFKPFTTTKPKGLGVGLAVSQTIIATHGGRLWAENNPESGATFRFTLKVAGGEGPVASGEQAQPRPASHPSPLPTKSIES